MRTCVIWRNPSPPPRPEFKLHRMAGNNVATVYAVESPNYKYPFELIRTVPLSTEGQKSVPVSQTELASGRG